MKITEFLQSLFISFYGFATFVISFIYFYGVSVKKGILSNFLLVTIAAVFLIKASAFLQTPYIIT